MAQSKLNIQWTKTINDEAVPQQVVMPFIKDAGGNVVFTVPDETFHDLIALLRRSGLVANVTHQL